MCAVDAELMEALLTSTSCVSTLGPQSTQQFAPGEPYHFGSTELQQRSALYMSKRLMYRVQCTRSITNPKFQLKFVSHKEN